VRGRQGEVNPRGIDFASDQAYNPAVVEPQAAKHEHRAAIYHRWKYASKSFQI
jgi:hypothetical protein